MPEEERMTALHMLRCDACDATTPAFADEGAMWRHVWEQGWTTVASLPAHYCPMCKGAAA
jgi:hypothetical protein